MVQGDPCHRGKAEYHLTDLVCLQSSWLTNIVDFLFQILECSWQQNSFCSSRLDIIRTCELSIKEIFSIFQVNSYKKVRYKTKTVIYLWVINPLSGSPCSRKLEDWGNKESGQDWDENLSVSWLCWTQHFGTAPSFNCFGWVNLFWYILLFTMLILSIRR